VDDIFEGQTSGCLDISTRYFSSRRTDPVSPAIPFEKMEDPYGTLVSLSDENYFHGEDNRVLYYLLTKLESGGYQ